jgi:alkyl hydroperoxide reductase subunit AhpC
MTKEQESQAVQIAIKSYLNEFASNNVDLSDIDRIEFEVVIHWKEAIDSSATVATIRFPMVQ